MNFLQSQNKNRITGFWTKADQLWVSVVLIIAKTVATLMITFKFKSSTLKSLIEEHARIDFSDFLSTLLTIFHVISEKFHPARLLIYLVNK